jgi:hypothetical protein
MRNKSFNLANMPKYGYICRALSKISKLALVGYNSLAHIVRSGLFLCVPFGYASFMVRLNGDTFECASLLLSLLTNPVQLNRPHLVMNGSTSIYSIGAHSHA